MRGVTDIRENKDGGFRYLENKIPDAGIAAPDVFAKANSVGN